MADISQIKLPSGNVYDIIDEKSGYITAQYIEDKTDYEIPVSRVGEIVVGETAIGTDSTNLPTSKAVVDYMDERMVQEIDAIDVGVTKVNGKTGNVMLSANDIGAATVAYVENGINGIQNQIPTFTSQLTNDSGFITASNIPTPDLSPYMQKGVDYVTAGKISNTTLGTKATAEGFYTTASGNYAHAEGYYTVASNEAAHAEGYATASGQGAHAEGNGNASGQYSHAEGSVTTAFGSYAHAEGYYTVAAARSQHVFGEFNIEDPIRSTTNVGTYIEIVGNGRPTALSNARTLDWSGNEVLAGKLTIGAGPTNNMDVATKQYVDNSIPTVPTKTSDLTNDSGFITTDSDEKLKTFTSIDSNMLYYPVLGDNSLVASTKSICDLFKFQKTSSSSESAELILGGVPGGYIGRTVSGLIKLCFSTSGVQGYYITIKPENSQVLNNYELIAPAKSGTIALTSDIPTIPTNISSFTNDSGYLTASDIASVMTYKGTKANYAALPSTGNTTGDVWHLTDTGAEWAWDGSAWQELGTAIDLSGYATKATTLAGYGITDVKIQNGTITLGGNTITPLTSYTETDPVFSASAAAGITSTDINNWDSKTSNTGTVTSVRVQATSPVQSSTSTAQSTSLNTTISLADAYGDTKNPYGSKTKNYVLAAPSTAAGVPSFRALVSADIPDLSSIYLPLIGGQVTGPVSFGDSISIDEATIGDLVVNGSASFTNNINVDTINGVEVGNSPKFTDTVTTISTSGNGNAITAISASNGVLTATKGTTFLTSYTETDPVFGASVAAGITSSDISNWNGKTSNTGTITSVKTTAGQHTTINVTSGAANFNVPTNTSHLTNDSGFLTLATLPIYDGTVE